MKAIINEPTNLYKPEKAEEVAAVLRANDSEWSYLVKHDPKGTGYSFIEIYDEDGEFVGKH